MLKVRLLLNFSITLCLKFENTLTQLLSQIAAAMNSRPMWDLDMSVENFAPTTDFTYFTLFVWGAITKICRFCRSSNICCSIRCMLCFSKINVFEIIYSSCLFVCSWIIYGLVLNKIIHSLCSQMHVLLIRLLLAVRYWYAWTNADSIWIRSYYLHFPPVCSVSISKSERNICSFDIWRRWVQIPLQRYVHIIRRRLFSASARLSANCEKKINHPSAIHNTVVESWHPNGFDWPIVCSNMPHALWGLCA